MAVSEKVKEEFLGELRKCKSVMANTHSFTDEEFNAAVEVAVTDLMEDPDVEGNPEDLEVFKELLAKFLVEVRGY